MGIFGDSKKDKRIRTLKKRLGSRDSEIEEKQDRIEELEEEKRKLESRLTKIQRDLEDRRKQIRKEERKKAKEEAKKRAEDRFLKEKNQEYLRKEKERIRKELTEEIAQDIHQEEKERFQKQKKEIEEKAHQKIHQMKREKDDLWATVHDFVRVVLGDHELASIFLDGDFTVDRFAVILQATEDQNLAEDLKNADREDVETLIRLRSENAKKKGFESGYVGAVKRILAGEDRDFTEEIRGKLDKRSIEILKALDRGNTGSGEIADFLDVSKSMVKKRYSELKDLDLIETQERSGAELTEKARHFLELL